MPEKVEEMLGQVAGAINEALPGQIISDSAEKVHARFADLERKAGFRERFADAN
jgi:hypothetical protein